MDTVRIIDKHRLYDRFATGQAMQGPLMRALLDNAAGGPVLQPGARIGPWKVLELLGSGGMSNVYLAERCDGAFEQQVALKLVRRNADLIHRLRHERQLIAHLRHPHIVSLIDSDETAEGDLWLAMGLVEGVPIDLYAQQNRLDWRARIRLVDAVCAAVEYAHGRGLIHRDIKPANVLVDGQGHPRLLDFGIALEQGAAKAPDHALTPGFAAPEQYHNRERLGPWTDIYSVGASLYACLAGYPPQAADARLLNDKLVPAAVNWRGAYSDQLLQTIDHCLKLNYMERPQSVFSLQKVLMDRSALEPKRGSLLGSLKRTLGRDLF